MNKNRGMKLLLGICLFAIVSIIPMETYAEQKSSGSSKPSECGSYCTNVCKTYSKVSITASPYTRKAGVHSSPVTARTITITTSGTRDYKVYIYHAKYGTFDEISVSEESDLDEFDDAIKVKKKTIAKGTTSWSWDLEAGREAEVIVLAKASTDSGKKWCKEKNADGTCKTKVKITCPNGSLVYGGSKVTTSEVNSNPNEYLPTDLDITGNGAALFVENPGIGDSGLVTNLRIRTNPDFGQACNDAYNGIYNSDNQQTKQQYSVPATDIENWRNNYYGKILGYCEQSYVDFNLNENAIKKISNQLLQVYYYDNALKATGDNLAQVQNKIADLEQMIKTTYGASNILYESKGQSPTIADLSCEYKDISKYRDFRDTVGNTDEEFNKKVKDEEYLYITKEDEKKATITNRAGDKQEISVCKTQCYEHLTVTYDAPQTVKAGMCLAYKVTVKSETECGVNSMDISSAMIAPDMCSPTPVCENNANSTQAGPSQEFDSCVTDCDGGKYTQSCINKCYKKVYDKDSNNVKTESATKTENTNSKGSINFLYNPSESNYEVARLAFDITDEEKLKYYYKENSSKFNTHCSTSNVSNYMDECAKYYFYAKSLYPCGKYNSYGTKWQPGVDDGILNCNITDAGATNKGVSNIPMQIGRAAPFYLRDVASTKDLLRSLLGYNDGVYKKYNITSSGIKRQYSSRYICNESCKFAGCEKGDAMSSSAYTKVLKNNLESITEALKGCNASAECEATSTTADFEIKVNTERLNSNDKETVKTGNTTIGTIIGQDSDQNSGTMFVPRKDDKTQTGILGQCYENVNGRPHYQTTITFPGSWIDLKTGKIYYVKQDDRTSNARVGEYCTPWDAKDVNVPYWMWVEKDKMVGNRLETTKFTPEYNITATLGDQDKKFGKYGWTIKFKCFYALNNEICDCKNNPSECPNPNLCPNDTDPPTTTTKKSCNSENSTELCNVKFRVIDQKDMFPSASSNNPRAIGFNWTNQAVDYNVPKGSSYDIDPEKYYQQLQQEAKAGENSIYNVSNSDYIVKLSKDNIKTIRQAMKNNTFTEFTGSYSTQNSNDPEGLRHYSISTAFEQTYTSGIEKRKGVGKNNDSNPTGLR